MILAEFGTGQVLWSMLWLSLFFLWFALVVMVFSDIMTNDSMSSASKGVWAVGIVILPYFGVLLYLIVNSKKSPLHVVASELNGSGSASTADELAQLTQLHASGALSDAEFQQAKARVVGGQQ